MGVGIKTRMLKMGNAMRDKKCNPDSGCDILTCGILRKIPNTVRIIKFLFCKTPREGNTLQAGALTTCVTIENRGTKERK